LLQYSDISAGRGYDVSVHYQHSLSFSLKDQWNRLADACANPGAVYQSPSYSEYLTRISSDHRVDLVVIYNKQDGQASGFVPVQHAYALLPWSARATRLGGIKLKSINLLGSEPNIPETFEAFDEVFSSIFDLDSATQVINMESIPADSFTWQYLTTSDYISTHYFIYVMHGFRDCHTVNIPASLESYHASLTRKKRYNLGRQKRSLEATLGQELSLFRIDKVADLHHLFSAIRELKVPASHDSILSESEFALACEYGFALCYVLKCGSKILGFALGTKSKATYRIHRFYYDKSFVKYSLGTTLWQEILRDLITCRCFVKVDMGFGAPTYQYNATNEVEKRGNVLLVRRSYLNFGLLKFYQIYSSIKSRVKHTVKSAAQSTRKRMRRTPSPV